eukprot:358829-Chlamydomonas_euryale.AAC.10
MTTLPGLGFRVHESCPGLMQTAKRDGRPLLVCARSAACGPGWPQRRPRRCAACTKGMSAGRTQQRCAVPCWPQGGGAQPSLLGQPSVARNQSDWRWPYAAASTPSVAAAPDQLAAAETTHEPLPPSWRPHLRPSGRQVRAPYATACTCRRAER